MNTTQKLRMLFGLAGAVAITAASGCAPAGSGDTAGQGPQTAAGIPLPPEAAHVHGVDVDPDTGEILVATHSGLVRVSAPGDAAGGEASAELVGPTIDLMGFAVAEPGRLLASGHPGPGVDLPDPVGLIESRDGGQTWEPLSRTGESDFHALAAVPDRVVGFDGRLRATEDGLTWTDLDGTVEPFSLALSEGGAVIVATTPQGPVRSDDGGRTFAPVAEAPSLVLVDWAPGTDSVHGVGADGRIHRSDDGGATWTETGKIDGEPQALHADADQLVVVADHHVVRSTDGGVSFHAW